MDEKLRQEIKIGSYTGQLWNDAIPSEQKIKLLQYPQKTYLEHITYKGRNYDVAIISRTDKKGLILCYVVRSKNALLSSRITVQDMLGALYLENGAVAFISNESGEIL